MENTIDMVTTTDKWRFIKEVSLGDLVAILFAGSAILLAYGKLESRQSVTETVLHTFVAAQTKRDESQDSALREMKNELIAYLVRIESRLEKQ